MHDNEVRNKFRKLVQQLISSTEKSKIVWTDTADEDAFRANMQGGMVRVQKRLRFDGEGHEMVDYSLTLLDRKGRELEDYSPEALAPENDLADLWNRVRRSSRSSIEVLDNLLKEIATEEELTVAIMVGRCESVLNRVTAEVIKRKAAQMGRIKEMTDDPQAGSLILVAEV